MLENLILKELDRVRVYIYIYIVRGGIFLRGDRKRRIETGAKDGMKIQNCLVRGRRKKRSIIVERWSERYGCYSKDVHP